jgi:hypothetical protein
MRKMLIATLFSAMLGGCMGYFPGRQSYGDAQVRELCAKDGGVTIYESLRILKSDIDLLGRIDGKIAIPSKGSANPKAPAYSELKITSISENNPRIYRTESAIIRRVDQAILARWVVYSRSGGDFPTGLSEGTSYICPDLKTITSNLQQLFIVDGPLDNITPQSSE